MESRVIKVRHPKRWLSRLGFRFDTFAWYTATERMNIDLDGLQDVASDKLLYSILYGAHESYCRHSLLKVNKYSFTAFKELIECLPYKTVLMLIEATTSQAATEEDKKKSPVNGAI